VNPSDRATRSLTRTVVAISQEQRKKLGLPQQEATGPQYEKTASLERIEEGQEIAPESAERLQPQMGNQAVQALLARTTSTTQTATGTADFELAEEVGEAQAEEQDVSSLALPDVSFGGGGDGLPLEASPWDVGRLFGGDDDTPPPKPRPKRSGPARARGDATASHQDDPFDEEELDAVHMDHIETTLGETPKMKEEYRAGDARYRAIEVGLQTPHSIGRRELVPESMVDRTDHLDPLGRATSIGRFMATAATRESARLLAKTTAGPASILASPQTGHAGASARLASLTVCIEALEGGSTGTDDAIRLALCRDAWPSALEAAREMAQTGRVVAPSIVEAAGELSEDNKSEQPILQGSHTDLAKIRLGQLALIEILPATHLPQIPTIHFSAPPAPPSDDPILAAMDATLAKFTGGINPADLPEEKILSEQVIQPVLNAATELVNAMGKAQVEMAAAAIALARVRPSPATRSTLNHTDRALRELARTVVQAGDKLHSFRGAPSAAVGEMPTEAIGEMRAAAEAFAALRVWAMHAFAEAMLR
jgi:hypothetical protein